MTPTAFGLTATLTKQNKSHWPNDILTLQMDVYFETENRARFKVLVNTQHMHMNTVLLAGPGGVLSICKVGSYALGTVYKVQCLK